MTWRDPTDLERFLLDDTRERWPEVLPLARCLTLAPRVEPLLLRNARRRFVPQAQAEIESRLWFGPLVATRSTREIVLHLGIARLLAEELKAGPPLDGYVAELEDPLETVWQFTCLHTRHWPAEDRLERDLRYQALRGDDLGLREGMRAILRRIAGETDEARRIALSRLAKRTLPVIGPALGPHAKGEARLLARYAALTLGDGGSWSHPGAQPGPPESLPGRLAARLPKPVGESELGAEIRWDPEHGNQVLHLTEARQGEESIRLPSPLPGQLHISAEGQSGVWYAVTRGTRIPIDPPSPVLRLTTLDGRQWTLVTESLPQSVPATPDTPEPLLLSHVEADLEQARAIADWLQTRGVPVELVAEGSPNATAATGQRQARMVRLWTRAARGFWAGRKVEDAEAAGSGLLLRTENVEPPATGAVAGRLLDWRDWQRLAESPRSDGLLRVLERWWREGEIPQDQTEPIGDRGPESEGEGAREATEVEPRARPSLESEQTTAAERQAEIARLLAEIADPKTEPPRRLEIGDRLAELGDTRPGVGTVEIEVPVDEEPDATIEAAAAGSAGPGPRRRLSYGREIDSLLAEIDDPGTEPPRRLEIGDRLAELGDPRLGVGLDARGLPDIDWVEIPSGPFIYQDGESRELPTFWIARYPVTNAQFQAFIDDGGYGKRTGLGARIGKTLGLRAGGEPEWWRGLKRPEPERPRWEQPNRPRTNVDWYEAVAFTRWLNARLGLPEGGIRLPTELEWEKAARGEEGFIYPWGNEYRSGLANVDERSPSQGQWYLGQTIAVGLYPEGRSPYRAEDLAGNVWEWCLNKYEDLEAVAPDTSGASRALRGGSWLGGPDDARADDRVSLHPGLRAGSWGFRLLSSVPIEPVR